MTSAPTRLRIRPHPSQKLELLDRTHRLIVNLGGLNSGKTFTDFLIMVDRGDWDTAQRGGFFANSENQILEGIWPDISELLDAAGIEYTFGAKAPLSWRRRWDREGTPYPSDTLRSRSTLILDTGLHVVIAGLGGGKFKRFKGWKFGWIILEEVTEQESQTALDYMIPRVRCGHWNSGECRRKHRHQVYAHGNPPPPSQPHWIRQYVREKERQEEARLTAGKRPFFLRIQSSTYENIEHAGPEYVDSILAALDADTAHAMLTGSLEQVRSSRAVRTFSKANVIPIGYDPNRTVYLSLDFNMSPATATLYQTLSEADVPGFAKEGTEHLGCFAEFNSGAVSFDAEELAYALVRDPADPEHPLRRGMHAPPNWRGLINHHSRIFAYGDATGNMGRIEARGNRSAWTSVNDVMASNLRPRYKSLVGKANPSVFESLQAVVAKFKAANGDSSLWVSDRCTELIEDLDFTAWRPDGKELDDSDRMRGHELAELRYIVHARYPAFSKRTPVGAGRHKMTREDEFDEVLPDFGYEP